MTVSVGEQLADNHQVTELPDDGSTTATSSLQQHFVETALLARIEISGRKLHNNDKSTDHKRSKPSSIDQIKHDDHQVSLYSVFLEFCQFLVVWLCVSTVMYTVVSH